MKAIYLDCFAGISGNMFLGALLDGGVPLEYLTTELNKLPVSGYKVVVDKVSKRGISACHVDVKMRKWFQPSRNLGDITGIIHKSELSSKVKEQAIAVFNRLAVAEAKVHGMSLDKVHFHEVGAVDAIVDIVGTVIGLEYLEIETVYASSLHVGTGFVKCSHGKMPIPAPATAELLTGVPFYSTDVVGELVTPTGAALVTGLAAGFGHMPIQFKSERIAYGAGTMNLDIANVLRMYIGKLTSTENLGLKSNEANSDDCQEPS